MKNINNSIPFYKMHQDIMQVIRLKGINFSVVFKEQRPFRSLNELVDQLHFLNRVR
jgi:hypothetical protein